MGYDFLIFVKLSTLVCLHLLTCHLLTICKWLKHSMLSLVDLITSVREINVAETDRVIKARQLKKKKKAILAMLTGLISNQTLLTVCPLFINTCLVALL